MTQQENISLSPHYLNLYLNLLLQHQPQSTLWLSTAIEGMRLAEQEYEQGLADINQAMEVEGMEGMELRLLVERAYYDSVEQIEALGVSLYSGWGTDRQLVDTKLASLNAELHLMQAQAAAGGQVVFAEYKAKQGQLNDFRAAANDYKKYDGLLLKLSGVSNSVESAVFLLNELSHQQGLYLHLGAEADVALHLNDLFIYGQHAEQIYEFGHKGSDYFYFGTNYSLITLSADSTLENTALGSAEQYEIFAQQQGADVILYVETESIQGSSELGFKGESLTLIGVEIEKLTFKEGFLVSDG